MYVARRLGYIRQADGQLAMDPDQQVQSVIRLIFETVELCDRVMRGLCPKIASS